MGLGQSDLISDASLHINRISPTDADELLAFIRRIQRDDPLRPVTVVAPSNYALLSLRHRLGRFGLANVHFMVFARLAELLGAPALSAQGRRPLTPIYSSAAVREVASEATGVLERVREHPSTHISLRSVFQQLRHASPAALDSLAAQGGLRTETIALYRKYLERIHGFYDNEELAESASAAVRDGSAHGLKDLGFVIFFRVRGLNPSQRLLVQALAEAGQCAMLLGETGDAQADESTHALANDLRALLGEPKAPFSNAAQTHTNSAGAHLLIAPDTHQEIRWVIRRIMQRAESNTPFHRMAVLYRKETPYGTLIREELTLAGIPVAGPNPASLADTAVGSTLLKLLSLPETEFARDAVMVWLTGCPIKPPAGIDTASFNPSLWDTVSKQAGIVSGIEQWGQRLNQFADSQEQDAAEWEAQDSAYESRAARMRFHARSACQLLRFIEDLTQKVEPASFIGGSWSQYSDWAKSLLDSYLADNLPDAESRAYDKIVRALDELKAADEISQTASFEEFRRALNEALQVSVGHLGSVGHGVFVAPLRLAAAMSFDVVHIVGMIEGAVPPAMRDDPLIPERDRERAGGAAEGLPLQQQQKDDERYRYLAALGTAPEYTLSYPVADAAAQRKNYPSRWLLESATALHGSPVASSDLDTIDNNAWLTRIVSIERSLDMARNISYADTHDYNLERLRNWKQAELHPASHPFSAEDLLASALNLSEDRQSSALTDWDGDLSSAAPGAKFAKGLLERSVSPTSLERWAKCPFSYFLGTALGLSSEENPEDIYTITPLERGSLIHGILEQFILDSQEKGLLPRRGGAWSDDDRQRLREIAEVKFRDAEQRGVTGRKLMWRIAKDEIHTDLEAFLDEDLRMRQMYGVSPALVEVNFGFNDDGWHQAMCELPDGTTLRFRGKIDRVDTSSDGKKALVLDYKTGSRRMYEKNFKTDSVIGNGQHLQLAIYSLAAQQAYGSGCHVGAAYWFTSIRGGFDLIPASPVNISSEEAMSRFKDGVSTIADGIRNGVFPANPGELTWTGSGSGLKNCTFCDFDTLCPSNRERQWLRKSNDPRLEQYLNLIEGE